MKKTIKGYVIGFLCAIILVSGVVYAVDTTTLYDVVADGVKIVIDGKEFTCTDVNGEVVEPMIYNGTTYIPVRAVSSAFGKAVYWDGEEKTVYLGNMDGKLEQPTLRLEDIVNIAEYRYYLGNKENIFDNKGNFYNNSVYYYSYKNDYANVCCETLLDKKYSTFRATLFIPEGSNWEGERAIKIIGDGEQIWPVKGEKITMNKTSEPIDIAVPIKEINNFKILFDDVNGIHIANAGFYQ